MARNDQANDQFEITSFLYGGNADYIEQLYADWQKIISDDLPFAFTTTEEFYSVYTTKLKGVPVNAFSDLQPLDKVYFTK